MPDEKHKYYITTTSGMRGCFAVLIDEADGFPEPVQSGIGSYRTAAEAAVEGRTWARAENLEFRD